MIRSTFDRGNLLLHVLDLDCRGLRSLLLADSLGGGRLRLDGLYISWVNLLLTDDCYKTISLLLRTVTRWLTNLVDLW